VKPATPPLDRRTVLEARSLLRRLRWSETVVLACLLVPLGLPALFFVSHLGAGLMILIASMALFFAGFLFSAIFQPFLLLKMQGDLAAVLDRENSRT
jgi:hypothetical protein